MSNRSKSKLKELLDRLEVESWQLELLVSGFAIFLTGSSFEPVLSYGSRLQVISDGLDHSFGLFSLFASFLLVSIFFVFVNLILHVVFRGLWISAIGLRSISGDIDFDALNFTQPFDRFMRKKLGSFDDFIQRLEDISSVIFAFTFLLIFMVISFVFFILFLGGIGALLDPYFDQDHAMIFDALLGVLVIILFLGAILYFLDFITLGFFKKKKWIAVWYYPIYRFYSIITFSWLYRPLYYNLIDDKFGRRVSLFLVPYFFLVFFIATMKASTNLYIPQDKDDVELMDHYFKDTQNENKRIKKISIPSKYITNDYLELFIKYIAKNDDKVLKLKYPSAIPDEESGLKTIFSIGQRNENATPPDSLLQYVTELYQIYIDDSLYQNLDYYFYTTKQYDEEGLKTIIDLQHEPRGKHVLKIKHLVTNRDSIYFDHFVETPFWIE